MAYLDENGIPRVSEGTQRHNDTVDSVARQFEELSNQVQCLYGELCGLEHGVARDRELEEMIMECRLLLLRCREQIEMYYMYG